MAKPFYERLKTYYEQVGRVLRGAADSSTIFPNSTDNGMSRERVYAEFLRDHVPKSCNVSFGGYLFGMDGSESDQVDIIVTADICPRFDFHNDDGHGKAFACIDGCLAAASCKATLTSAQLKDCLKNFASLPAARPTEGRVNPQLKVPNLEDWPFKIVYAADGVSVGTAMTTIHDFYVANPVPHHRRPNLIHVGGKYVIHRSPRDETARNATVVPANTFYPIVDPSDAIGLSFAIDRIQKHACAVRDIIFDYPLLEHLRF